MPAKSKTILFFGNERLATGVSTTAPTLEALVQAGYHVAAVVSNFTQAQSRQARELEIEAVAKKHGIPLLLPASPADILDNLKAYKAEAGILVAYGRLVPEELINLFPKGIINIHPSLLPLHRGPTPIESTILEGRDKTGVSIMALAKEMDAGPVYAQSEVPLTGKETKQELADQLLEVGKAMLLEILPEILEGSVVALPQDESHANYDKLISKADGVLDWHKPAVQLEREIRAFAGWPKSRTVLSDKHLVITAAHVEDKALQPGQTLVDGKQLLVGTGEGSLSIDRLKPAGKGEMDIAGFLAGYQI